MDHMVPLSEAKARLHELVRVAQDDDVVVLLRHGRPAALLISPAHYDAVLEELEDLRDRVALRESDELAGLAIPLEKVGAELGLS